MPIRDISIKGRIVMIDDELLEILACPKCKEKVVLDEKGTYLVCETCNLRYPIEDDIPIMLIDRAEKTN
jgi:uncharacterized protein YbaR (Trm112 family)